MKDKGNIFSPLVNLILFDLLLILTPFIMLQNYLQKAVKMASHQTFGLAGFEMPIVLSMFVVLLIVLLILNIQKIGLREFIVFSVVIIMMVTGQWIADYYIDYSFYDLQNNWHYFAYGIFVFVAYQYLKVKNLNDKKLILFIASKAFIISAFDEGIQVFISNRIFDISDIAKDMLGMSMGLIILFYIQKKESFNFSFLSGGIKNLFNCSNALITQLVAFCFLFLFISSNLTEVEYWYYIILLSLLFFGIFLIIEIALSTKISRIALIVFAAFTLAHFTYHGFISEKKNEIYVQFDITCFKGLPLLFMDFMIYPDGSIRVVDKKKVFRGSDFSVFSQQGSDILLIAAGEDKSGGQGFETSKFNEFPYFLGNEIFNRQMQVVILNNSDAFVEYNRLVNEYKKVLLVIHQSL